MKTELRVWVDCYSPSEYQHKADYVDELALVASFQEAVGNDRVQLQGNTCILISDFSMEDLAVVKRIAGELRIPIICKADDSIAKSELRQVRFASLTVEGDYVDVDSEGIHPLNYYPLSLCPNCNMPDENHLPEPFYVSAKQMLRRKQDGVPDEWLAAKREIFHGHCAVFVVSERIKCILDVLEQPFVSARVMATGSKALPFLCWAIRPAQFWGREKHFKIMKRCPRCEQPQQGGTGGIAITGFWRNRIILEPTTIPGFDFVCCETWCGDKTKRPADFIRDVFVSGRLYEVLLRAKIHGLMRPQEFIAIDDVIPMVDNKTAQSWVKSKLELLKSEGLVD